MTSRTLLIAAVGLSLIPAAPLRAADLSGQSRTYLQTRELTDGTRLTPLYEYLNVGTDTIGSDAVSFAAGGWYRYYLQSTDFDTKDTGDLQYAYLTFRRPSANAALRIGRVLVNEGAVSSHLDGAAARTDLRGGFTVGAFGGIPLETDPDGRSGDSVYGGRISHGVAGIYTLGASYLKERNDRTDLRTEEGVDVWLRPVNKVELMGVSTYNGESRNWMQHQYHAALGPFAWLRLNLDASKTWYREYFAVTTLSAFSFANLDPDEIVTITGGSAVVAAGGSFSFIADYHSYEYQVLNGSATYAGGSVVYADAGLNAGAGLHRMNGPTAALRYDEQRVYASKKIGRSDITLDVLHVAYDQAVNGETAAWSGSAALGRSFSPRVRVVADAEYSKNPDYDRDIRGMLTVQYSFDLPLGAASGPKPASPRRKQTPADRERS